MSKIVELRNATERLKAKFVSDYFTSYEDKKKNYMSDINNWVCVHATYYMPRKNQNGQLYIPTTAMATNYEFPRATIHVTLNQVVCSHMYGNWDDAPFVILAPYNSVVEINGTPQQVATEDTWFIPNPDTGLVLPDNAFIVMPNDDLLFSIGEKVATYKTYNFTDAEKEMILSQMSYLDRYYYEGYSENSEKQRHMLYRQLRNIVTSMALEKMGYNYVASHEDDVSNVVCYVACQTGLAGCCGDKGHYGSAENKLEKEWSYLIGIMDVLETKNIDDICKALANVSAIDWLDEKLDFYHIYLDALSTRLMSRTECVSIAAYNPFLDITIRRHVDFLTKKHAKIIKDLKRNGQYDEIKRRLETYKKQSESEKDFFSFDGVIPDYIKDFFDDGRE